MNEKLSSLPSPYALTTDNTELVFVKKDALWRVAHYGERSNVAADAVLLTECRYNAESFGRATLETYPSFGADYGDNDGQMGMCKYGAIQAQHADGNTTIAYYYNGGKYYAYRTEVSANNYSYTAEVFDIYDSLSEEEKSCVRYDNTALDPVQAKITLTGTEENAGRWTEVAFYVATGNTAKDYRLEIWAGSRDFTVAEDGAVTATGTQIPANSYFFFDSYASTDVSDSYADILAEKVDDLKENSANLVDPEDPESDLNSSLAAYYTFTFYDSKEYLRYDATTDEEGLGDPYGSYDQSAYSEDIAWLRYDEGSERTLFVNYSLAEVTVEQDDLGSSDDGHDHEDETTATGDTNVWMIVSSAILAFALIFVVLLIIVRRVTEKVKRAKAAKIKPVVAPVTRRTAPVKPAKTEKPAAPERDEDDPYNE